MDRTDTSRATRTPRTPFRSHLHLRRKGIDRLIEGTEEVTSEHVAIAVVRTCAIGHGLVGFERCRELVRLPLAAEGGRLLALKGESAVDEISTHRRAVMSMGGTEPVIRRCGAGVIDPPTTVVEIVRQVGSSRRRK